MDFWRKKPTGFPMAVIVITLLLVLGLAWFIWHFFRTTWSHPTHPAPVASDAFVIEPAVGIGSVRFGMKTQEIVKFLGSPERSEDEGTSLIYAPQGFTLSVSPSRGLLLINCLSRFSGRGLGASDFAGETKNGIAMGSTEAEIKRVYGEPTRRQVKERQVTLKYDKTRATFLLFEDRLVQMMFMAPRRQ